jgi:hypothetical protein
MHRLSTKTSARPAGAKIKFPCKTRPSAVSGTPFIHRRAPAPAPVVNKLCRKIRDRAGQVRLNA